MTGRIPTAEEQVQFLLNVQRLLEEARLVASYKPALLIAIADAAVELGSDGEELAVSSRQLAERFVRYYWRQAAPYVAGQGRPGETLIQNTGQQAAVLNIVMKARTDHDSSFTRFRRDTKRYGDCMRQVATIIRKMPLWKLQTIGNQRLSFLYANEDRGTEIVLRSSAVFCLRQFHGLVVDLAQSTWLRFVRGLHHNHAILGQAQDLREFLFGTERSSLSKAQQVLEDFQSGRCFYCADPIRDRGAVDHFIPWARYNLDLGHNFVLAHDSCNGHKSDILPGIAHLKRWASRNSEMGSELATSFEQQGVFCNLDATWRIARWAYSQAEVAGAQVWEKGREDLCELKSNWATVPGMCG